MAKSELKVLMVLAALAWPVTTTSASLLPDDWLDWTYPTAITARADAGVRGSLDVSVFGAQVYTSPIRFEFDAPQPLPAQPTLDESLSVNHGFSVGIWYFDFDFSTGFDTSGFVLGVGNFGHGSKHYPGYRLSAFDAFDNIIPLAGFTQVGGSGFSYDHTWQNQQSFNDDVSLDLATGVFEITTVPGADDDNSDMLLLELPADVSRLRITSLPAAPGTDAGGDTINIVAFPEPTGHVLASLGIAACALIPRRHARR